MRLLVTGAAGFIGSNFVRYWANAHPTDDIVAFDLLTYAGDLPLDSDERFTEESPYRPRTPYNASKAAADHAVRAYHETYGLPVTITNCCNNYGPYQFPEKVVALFTTNALDNRPLPLYASTEHKRE